ncbi:methyltransferase cognate corrinoid protein [Methanomassiliicoccus luminyensis]|uniref:methyltransferase cognate corrinoid protein n=1 Tax=Methanomassiliicoccus luminyensis TaxID=1080712 RepID=UPI000673DF76|nr:methyltransferase cognate corrinoid protein [Methanomassiliicoccus luminyensis]
MTDKQAILADLKRSVETWNKDLAASSAQAALDAGMPPSEAIDQGLGKGMETISALFDEAKIYLPQVLAASTAMEAALKTLGPAMSGGAASAKGTVVLGTVQGDIHEIGKNVVAAMLRGAGYNVIDLGRDVPVDKFVETAEKEKAKVIGASALMTTTMVGQKEIQDLVKEGDLDVRTVFGGAVCSAEWVASFGGDAYCSSAAEASATVASLTKE